MWFLLFPRSVCCVARRWRGGCAWSAVQPFCFVHSRGWNSCYVALYSCSEQMVGTDPCWRRHSLDSVAAAGDGQSALPRAVAAVLCLSGAPGSTAHRLTPAIRQHPSLRRYWLRRAGFVVQADPGSNVGRALSPAVTHATASLCRIARQPFTSLLAANEPQKQLRRPKIFEAPVTK